MAYLPLLRVTVRGQEFETVAHCAKHFKVTKSAVYTALHRGTMDTLGTGMARKYTGKPLTIGGVHFKSMRWASMVLGMHDAYVSQVLRRGTDKQKKELMYKVMKYQAEQEKKQRKQRQQQENYDVQPQDQTNHP